ncbi:fibroblast growth factor receptor substrate 2 (predicted), isoform CRA_a [Rattus norvegicus]|uniref:Fibroblast growth factor receptor substrate 2 (Predicted), isoform CRA_a n=1 Tax=Rattus norvegicus TaxID=10116 RepID=A6IGR6_RAT|nr:fibroblast growth factor receptor substrate 2 (predicted), isoform CRA_a [Rattus norvegicus]
MINLLMQLQRLTTLMARSRQHTAIIIRTTQHLPIRT